MPVQLIIQCAACANVPGVLRRTPLDIPFPPSAGTARWLALYPPIWEAISGGGSHRSDGSPHLFARAKGHVSLSLNFAHPDPSKRRLPSRASYVT